MLSQLHNDSSVVEKRDCERKVTGPWFDSRTGNGSLCPWKRHLMLISHSEQSTHAQAVYPLWWPSLIKDLQTEPKKLLYVGVVRDVKCAWVLTNEVALFTVKISSQTENQNLKKQCKFNRGFLLNAKH